MLEPTLTRPIGAAVVAAMLYSMSIPPYPDWLEWIGDLFWMFGIIAGVVMVVTFADYTFFKIAWHVENMVIAWSAAQVRFAEAIAAMRPDQVDILEHGGVIKIRPGPGEPGQLNWFITTPLMDIPLWWFREFVDACELTFPDIPPQHGLPDNHERALRQAFTKLVCDPEFGIAAWNNGNKCAEWLLPNMAAVRDALGV